MPSTSTYSDGCFGGKGYALTVAKTFCELIILRIRLQQRIQNKTKILKGPYLKDASQLGRVVKVHNQGFDIRYISETSTLDSQICVPVTVLTSLLRHFIFTNPQSFLMAEADLETSSPSISARLARESNR